MCFEVGCMDDDVALGVFAVDGCLQGPCGVEQEGDLLEMLQRGIAAGGDLGHNLPFCSGGEIDGALRLAVGIGQRTGEPTGGGDCGGKFHVGSYPTAEYGLSLSEVFHTDVEVVRFVRIEYLTIIAAEHRACGVHRYDGVLEVVQVVIVGDGDLLGSLVFAAVDGIVKFAVSTSRERHD